MCFNFGLSHFLSKLLLLTINYEIGKNWTVRLFDSAPASVWKNYVAPATNSLIWLKKYKNHTFCCDSRTESSKENDAAPCCSGSAISEVRVTVLVDVRFSSTVGQDFEILKRFRKLNLLSFNIFSFQNFPLN
jgi:hypothetical protein